MPSTLEIQKTQNEAQSPSQITRPTSEARLSAVVQAAYILEARSR